MARFGMPAHITRHSVAVRGVALYLARRLKARGLDLNLELVQAGALLHDITKHRTLGRPLDHALTGAKLMKRLGLGPVATLVGQHVRLSASRPAGRVSEVEVVNYADKRVIEDQVATLDQRLEYIRRRYGRDEWSRTRIEKMAAMIYRMEREIFVLLAMEPESLLQIDPQKEQDPHEDESFERGLAGRR
jgi:putative nucleotidyltransferase with HDIG domain